MTKYYDVCCDYSTDPREKPTDLDKYRTNTVKEGITFYFHKQYDELHYASVPEGVDMPDFV